mmetsp:Transcript_34401/g.80385  ORF Transcript_34401/g.80385 Transcript_34401/m.80385 type:complete len:186 (-) Transcript_34401:80-637(-)|eukprot:CAMPEP_0117009954 /NCGR_PEP_ID=MMETSP0472-20121206/8904_1 /TAXON_ID=693140 ORGANISM="Tiarina fusus, Strain LIS" /NCGR_SAMPLE_ID=MMETSP0472 /ASSEMBLY_ACC=CAM_ASM_000603 /LENGTH=185 /DNA_ID=CAMNT_0004712379 /DNA_START=75 /DNA_END=632 /DNA_ORIENTATION=+
MAQADGEDVELLTKPLRVEQKRIYLNLRENPRGRYLRIAEVTGTNRSTIIVPASGLQDFRDLLDEFIAVGPSDMVFTEAPAGGRGRGRRPDRGEAGKQPLTNRIFVGNLSWSTQWHDLKEHFSSVGEVVRADIFTETKTNRSRGCGMVEFASVEEAAAAIATLNNTELDGRVLHVREDREPVSDE